MKVHKYIVFARNDLLEQLHSRKYLNHRAVSEAGMAIAALGNQLEYRLYIPGQGILGYTKKGIEFFSDDPKDIEEAEFTISGEGDELRKESYLGEIELPDDLVMKAVAAGKRLNQAEKDLKENTKSLIELIQE